MAYTSPSTWRPCWNNYTAGRALLSLVKVVFRTTAFKCAPLLDRRGLWTRSKGAPSVKASFTRGQWALSKPTSNSSYPSILVKSPGKETCILSLSFAILKLQCANSKLNVSRADPPCSYPASPSPQTAPSLDSKSSRTVEQLPVFNSSVPCQCCLPIISWMFAHRHQSSHSHTLPWALPCILPEPWSGPKPRSPHPPQTHFKSSLSR